MTNRRNILKSVATGVAVSGIGFSGVSSAAAADDIDPEAIIASSDVQLLLDEAGNPEITDAEGYRQVVDGQTVTAVDFTTTAGELKVTDLDDGELNAAFLFDETGAELPAEYSGIPNIEKSILSVESGEVVFARQATSEERAKIQSVVGTNLEDSVVFYNSVVDGFEIRSQEIDEKSTSSGRSGNASAGNGKTQVAIDANRHGEISSASPRPILTTECNVFACAACTVTMGTGSAVCGYVCKGSLITGPWGKAACLTCLLAAGVSLSGPCLECANTCG
jgi:hypothetical protein